MPHKDIDKRRKYSREFKRAFQVRRPTWRRDQHLRLTFGITQVEWDALFERQGYCCAACGSNTAGRTSVGKDGCWHTDHNPAYTKGHLKFIRGILCHWCNLAANKRNTPATLRTLADYLERNQ